LTDPPAAPRGSFLRDLLGFLRLLARRWGEDRCPQVAGSLTFATLLALAPAFAIVVAMFSSMPFFERAMVRLKVFLLVNLVPEMAGRIITVYMEQFAQAAGKLTLVSAAVLLASSLAVMFTMDRTLNRIWRVRRPRPLLASLATYLLLLAAGPLLVGASVSATQMLLALASGVERVPEEAHGFLARSASVAVSTMTFFLIYRLVPHRRVAWRHAVLGGAIAGVLFEAMKELFAAWVRAAPTYDLVYGAFAAVPLFLVWVYLAWLVVLLGAEVTACAELWGERPWERVRSQALPLVEALELVRLLSATGGAPLAFERLRQELRTSAETLEDRLAELSLRGIVRRVGPADWVLARSPSELTLAELTAALGRGVGLESGR
jgi:membrane protein